MANIKTKSSSVKAPLVNPSASGLDIYGKVKTLSKQYINPIMVVAGAIYLFSGFTD